MSIQSDTEMISISAVERYAEQNHLEVKEVYELFYRHQIFEKIILQHEYLHQISMEEVMEFIYKEIQMNQHELVLFHGTNIDFTKIQLNKSHNKRDFGMGFYTTILETQAKEWAYRLSLRNHTKAYYVMKFLFDENDHLKIKRFNSLDKEWLEFIKENRTKGRLQHKYDVVIGPVADDNTMETVQLYIAGIFSTDEAVNRLRYNKVNNQISFHTEESLKYLKFIGRNQYDGDLYL
ncbi:hypothetical protein P261_02870 [Lachnospiraceae bacterium TWA4]|nr:hypothetical protein P261_02870 [Lachnospiraceae bacterium TWA4]